MTQKRLNELINSGIVDRVGKSAFTLLSVIVNKAKEESYPEVLEASISEIRYKTGLRARSSYKNAKDILLDEELIKGYEYTRDTGYFYLNYEY